MQSVVGTALVDEDLVDYDQPRRIRCAKAAATPYQTSALAAIGRDIKRQPCDNAG
jgi:hypothetical protein